MSPYPQRAQVNEGDSATLGHCRRVAALALEVGRRAGIPSGLEAVLEQAAQFHHALDLMLEPTPLARLAWDVLCADAPGSTCPPPIIGVEARTVLSLFHHRAFPSRTLPYASPKHDASPKLRNLAGILAICNWVDEQCECLEFEYKEMDTILDEIEGFAALEGFDPDPVVHLRRMRCAGALQQMESGEGLPVEAGSARRVFQALAEDREYDVEELEALAMRDPVLAGNLIGVANSALYNPFQPIGLPRQAVAHIGTIAARRILLAGALRPLFASAGLNKLWSHSINAAQFCSALAAQTTFISAGEGLTLGLLHDIGALAAEFLPRETMETRARLTDRGCPATYAERLLLGADHGETGARILARWGLPDHMLEAVRFHHQPERATTPLAAFLYLAEFWAGRDEDLPSFNRVEDCLLRTGLSLESLTQVGIKDTALKALRAVA